MELFDYIFCDDIRSEINNKVSLMGVFNDRLIVRATSKAPVNWPVLIRLCAFLRLRFEENEKRPDTFTYEYLINGKPLGSLEGLIRNDPNQNFATITVMAQGIPLDKGEIGFQLTLKKSGSAIKTFSIPKALRVLEEIIPDV